MEDKSLDIDWAALIDLFASEYGWTIEYIKNLDLGQVMSLKEKIYERYEKQNSVSEDNGSMPSGDQELSISDFETKLGGKRRIRKDGITEIII